MNFSDERLAALAAGQLEDVPLPETIRALARQLLDARERLTLSGRVIVGLRAAKLESK